MAELSAGIVIIGDEILSGRTQDTNTGTIARFLAGFGIDVREVRVVPDVEDDIVAAVNALRPRYTYVFTTGGIGPTHDDITSDAIAKAFGVATDFHPEALALLESRYPPGEFNAARKRMARVPSGATLIANSVSAAPGFRIGNVFVMAGVPRIMEAMLEAVAPGLARGTLVASRSITVHIPEGRLAEDLGRIQARYAMIAIGSYPFFGDDKRPPGTVLVVRGRNVAHVDQAIREIEILVGRLAPPPHADK